MEQKNIQVEVQGKNVLPTPIKNLRELTAGLSETEEHLEGVETLANSANAKADKLGELVDDKYYDASPSGKGKGMGRINLPMNKVYNHNILTQDMIQYTNTIYKIQYDYEIGDVGVINLTEGYESMIIDNINYFYQELELKAGETLNVTTAGGCILRYDSYQWVLVDGTTYTAAGDETVRVGAVAYQLDVVDYYKLGGEITIPENCVLEFDGGSLSGGSIDVNGAYVFPLFNSLGNINVEGTPAAGTLFYNGGQLNISNGTKWVESDGAIAGVQRAGLITKRPATSDIPVGFTYVVTTSFDIGGTTYNAGVYAYIGSENWITPDGTTVSDGTLPTRS